MNVALAQQYKSTKFVAANKFDQRPYQFERKIDTQYDHVWHTYEQEDAQQHKVVFDQPYKYEVSNDTAIWMRQYAESKDQNSSDEEVMYEIIKDNLELDRLHSLGITLENSLEDNISQFRDDMRHSQQTTLAQG